MKSRSGWLKRTTEYNKQFKSGRKYFGIHKNQQSPNDLSEKRPQVSPLNQSIEPPKNKKFQSYTPKPMLKSHTPFQAILSEKSHLRESPTQEKPGFLRKFFSPLDPKPKSVNRIRPNYAEIDYTPLPEIGVFRNKSTSHAKPSPLFDFPLYQAFKQPRFPKNRPKINITNPITGIPLIEFPNRIF